MKAVFTVWNGRIAPVFDVAGRFEIVYAAENGIISKETVMLPTCSFIEKASFLIDNGISDLVCGAITKQAQYYLTTQDITVYPYVAGDIDEIILLWQKGELWRKTYTMPGCHKHRHGHGRKRDRYIMREQKNRRR